MAKRDFYETKSLHILPTDSSDNNTDSSVYNHVNNLNFSNNNIRTRKKIKYLRKSSINSNMDNSLSRKSTSDEDNLIDQHSSESFDSLKHEGSSSSDGLKSINNLSSRTLANLSSEGVDNRYPSQNLKLTENSKVIQQQVESDTNVISKELNTSSENVDEQLKEKLTPSRKADYIHTLLSGRTSLDDSFNILNRMTSENENNKPNTVKDGPNGVNLEKNISDDGEKVKYNTMSEDSKDYDNQNEQEDDAQELISSEPKEEVFKAEVEDKDVGDLYVNEVENNNLECVNDEDDSIDSFDYDFEDLKDKTEVDRLIEMYRRVYNSYINKSISENEKLRVVVRCIPGDGPKKVIECDKSCIKLLRPGNKNSIFKSQRPGIYEFNFDYIVPEDETTEQLYKQSCSDVIQKIMSGTSVTVFAYGSTGSGKTHTISGDENNIGLVYLMISDLFRRKEKENENEDFYFSYFEVYNENVYDLFMESEKNLKLQEVENTVFVRGLTKVKVTNYEEFVRLLEIGTRNRKVFSTKANRSSSRSHAIIQVQTSLKSKLTLIDLAGSERMKITENTGERLKESSYINQSLLALINCINTLSRNSKCLKNMDQDGGMNYSRVKYRDSKLTHLLKNSLGSNCFIIMIAHINPDTKFYQDTYNTIKYALRAKNVELTEAISKGKCGKEVIKKFTKELLYLINLMKNQMSSKQLRQIKEEVCRANLIGRPILECLVE